PRSGGPPPHRDFAVLSESSWTPPYLIRGVEDARKRPGSACRSIWSLWSRCGRLCNCLGSSSLGADAGTTGFFLSSLRSDSHQSRPLWAGCLGGCDIAVLSSSNPFGRWTAEPRG